MEETKKDFIIRILSEQHKNELEGKGYDFYFVLRTELDKLLNNPLTEEYIPIINARLTQDTNPKE